MAVGDIKAEMVRVIRVTKESPEIDMERMEELLRSVPLTCIPKEEPKGVQENIDAVICALSKDIVDTITGKKGFPWDGKEVVEKTQALASLVEASTCRCEKSVF